MGLDGLISSPNNVAQYVKEMVLCGEWKETDTGDFEKGRVPDNTMMLNIVIKAAISRAGRLEKFAYVIDMSDGDYENADIRQMVSKLKANEDCLSRSCATRYPHTLQTTISVVENTASDGSDTRNATAQVATH
jgi:hypothetical protein